MRIVITADGKTKNSEVSKVFGRCNYFLIFEIENKKPKLVETIQNKNANQIGRAGVSAAQTMAEKNANAVITGNVGPRAMDVLRQFGIKAYNGSGQVNEVLEKFLKGKLSEF